MSRKKTIKLGWQRISDCKMTVYRYNKDGTLKSTKIKYVPCHLLVEG